MNDSRSKSESRRAPALATGTPRDENVVDHSYHHLRAKFIHHDIEEEDEEEQEDLDDTAAVAETRRLRQHHARSSERFVIADTHEDEEDDGDGSSYHPSKASLVRETTGAGTHGGSVAELCQYIQKLESEKRDLVEQVHFLRDQDATRKLQLASAARRIEKLESLLQNAGHVSDSQQQVQRQIEEAIALEKEKTTAMASRLENMQRKYDDTERARQHAVFKLSELQTTMAEATTNRLLTPPYAQFQQHRGTSSSSSSSRPSSAAERERDRDNERDPTTGSNERMEKYKREIELLRQKLELRQDQSHEKQKLAVEIALRSAHLDHAAVLEKVKLECEIKLSEWRHEEAVRGKEIEAAMEEDRYGIRLEMKHGMQRAQIDQRVYYLQAQAALSSVQPKSPAATAAGESDAATAISADVPFSAMDEVLVRMQLELLRTKRFGALKKLLLIRKSHVDRAMRAAVVQWKTVATQAKMSQWNAARHLLRIAKQLEKRDLRESFSNWKTQTQLWQVDMQRQQAAACWNRMVAVERMVHVMQHRMVKTLARSFHRWRLHAAPSIAGTATGTVTASVQVLASPGKRQGEHVETTNPLPAVVGENGGGETAVVVGGGAELQEEIKKLHDQLASSKSEAWRYKRQLLKQFL